MELTRPMPCATASGAPRDSWAVFVQSLAVLIPCALVDYAAGEFTVFFLYLIPITWAVWNCNRSVGLIVALLAIAAWAFIDVMQGTAYGQPVYRASAILGRLAVFLVFAFVLAELKSELDKKRRANDELVLSQTQLRSLAVYLQDMREQEKAALARELHDELGATLTALKIDAQMLAKNLQDESDQIKLTRIVQATDDATSITRRIVTELRPTILDHLGLAAAIEWQAREFEKHGEAVCAFDSEVGNLNLEPSRSLAIFRIAQEALTNIMRHAQASQVEIRLAQSGGNLILTIHDNGVGITDARTTNPESHGVSGMLARAISVEGTLDITGVPNQGTTVTLRVPL